MTRLFFLLVATSMLMGPGLAAAGEIKVAIAANFTKTGTDIAQAFEKKTGDRVLLSFGSTGKLYAQIAHGAPFSVFLSADQARASKAVDIGIAVAGSQFTYAIGKLVLFSADAALIENGDGVLHAPDRFQRLAIANPDTAPYGAAAVETMTALNVYDALKPKLVKGDSIAQTYQFVATGNAQLGFVALSQVIGESGGSQWVVPENLYAPIRQDAVLTQKGAENDIAKAFLAFLKSDEAAAIMERYGYAIE